MDLQALKMFIKIKKMKTMKGRRWQIITLLDLGKSLHMCFFPFGKTTSASDLGGVSHTTQVYTQLAKMSPK